MQILKSADWNHVEIRKTFLQTWGYLWFAEESQNIKGGLKSRTQKEFGYTCTANLCLGTHSVNGQRGMKRSLLPLVRSWSHCVQSGQMGWRLLLSLTPPPIPTWFPLLPRLVDGWEGQVPTANTSICCQTVYHLCCCSGGQARRGRSLPCIPNVIHCWPLTWTGGGHAAEWLQQWKRGWLGPHLYIWNLPYMIFEGFMYHNRAVYILLEILTSSMYLEDCSHSLDRKAKIRQCAFSVKFYCCTTCYQKTLF